MMVVAPEPALPGGVKLEYTYERPEYEEGGRERDGGDAVAAVKETERLPPARENDGRETPPEVFCLISFDSRFETLDMDCDGKMVLLCSFGGREGVIGLDDIPNSSKPRLINVLKSC